MKRNLVKVILLLTLIGTLVLSNAISVFAITQDEMIRLIEEELRRTGLPEDFGKMNHGGQGKSVLEWKNGNAYAFSDEYYNGLGTPTPALEQRIQDYNFFYNSDGSTKNTNINDYVDFYGDLPGNVKMKNSHGHKYEKIVEKEATCKEEGSVKYLCSCGDEYIESIFRIEHTYQEEIVPATCKKDGKIEEICLICGDKQEEIIQAIGHEYNITITKEASCIAEGYNEYTCNNCQDTYRESISKMEHQLSDWIIETKARILKSGKQIKKCKICNEILKEEEIPSSLKAMWTNIFK